MEAKRAWVLNLDADVELAAGAGYAPTQRTLAAMRPHVATLARTLLAPGELLVDEDAKPGGARGLAGRAFCPTPRAIALLVRAGAEPEAHPPFEVLRKVNSRAFAHGLGATMDGAAFVTELEAARAKLSTAPPLSERWRVKRAFGMAGRGQRVLAPGPLGEADLAFLRAGVEREGGVQVEPNVPIEAEHALHGLLAQDGGTTLGSVVLQRCDARGAWLATELAEAGALGAEVEDALTREAQSVAAALHAAGYFGPFGVDSFTYRALDCRLHLQPRSEINARYSMGFAVGLPGA